MSCTVIIVTLIPTIHHFSYVLGVVDDVSWLEVEENSESKENHVPEKEVMVEKDQINSVEGENEGVPQDNTTPAEDDAPNSEKKYKSPIITAKNGNEINTISLF
jgi:hypothetical protein